MDLIYTNAAREEQGVLQAFELDMAFGADENDFECTVTSRNHVCENGSLLFFEGTEYGGIVDSIESNTATDDVTYSGRTWHGILNSKVLEPDSGKDYLVLNGEANEVLASLVQRMELTELFSASTEDSKLTISNYKMNRYIQGYDGIMKMLASAGGKLKIAFMDGLAVLSAHPIKDYTQDEEFDSDLVPFTAKKNFKSVNHLVCLGSGELSNRLVVHLYADEEGNISDKQTLTDIDEITSIFEYSQISDEAELIAEGKAKFKELLASDEIVIDFDADTDEYDVGDIIGAVDNVTGLSAHATIKKKVLAIKNGQFTISLEPDTAKSGSTQETVGGGGSGGGSGATGATFTPSVDADGNLSWTNDKGFENPATVNIKGKPGVDGQDGSDGTDGVSPTVSVTDITGGHRITITDKNGTTTVDVMDGGDGQDGHDGSNGKDGTSATHSWSGTVLTITSASGTSSADLKGEKGADGSDATVTAESIQNALGYAPLKANGWAVGKNLGTDENGNVIEKEDIFSKDTSAWEPVEYMSGVAWTGLGYYWTANGTRTSTQYTTTYQATQELIRIEPNCSYILSAFAGTYFLYDSTEKNGVAIAKHTNPNEAITFETNANQYYIGINHEPTGSFTVDKVSLVRTTISEVEYNALPTRAESLKSLYGKKVVCFGDSLFGMHRGEDSAPAFVAAETGATVYNVGFGGCRMSVHHSSGYAEFSMWALAKAIAENDWVAQDEAAPNGSSYFPEQLALLKSIDFSNVDIAVIHYGTNDFGAGNAIAIDNAADHDDYTTLCGALRYSVEKLLGAYPKLRIYVSLPAYRYWTDNGVNTYAETYIGKSGKTLPDFAEALRKTAAEYNLPVIDSYYGLGINKENASAFLSDGTHHNTTGRERFGRYIGQNLIAQQSSAKSGMDTDAVNALIEAAIGSAIGGSY